MRAPLDRAWWIPGVDEERMGVKMPSRKDNPDTRLTIGYSNYRLPRSGLVQDLFLKRSYERRRHTDSPEV